MKVTIQKGLYLLWGFVKTDDERATDKNKAIQLRWMSLLFCLMLMIALVDIWWCRTKCWASWDHSNILKRGTQKKMARKRSCSLAEATEAFWSRWFKVVNISKDLWKQRSGLRWKRSTDHNQLKWFTARTPWRQAVFLLREQSHQDEDPTEAEAARERPMLGWPRREAPFHLEIH